MNILRKLLYNDAVSNNKCPHVRLYKQMNKTKNILKKERIIRRIRNFYV